MIGKYMIIKNKNDSKNTKIHNCKNTILKNIKSNKHWRQKMFGKTDLERNIDKGNICLKKGLITKARDYYLKALAIEPDDIAVLNNLAYIYALLNEEDKSKGYLELLIKECDKKLEKESSLTLLTMKVCALMSLNRLNEANYVASEILKIDPDNLIALIQKSQYFELNNDYIKALTYIDEILRIYPLDISSLLSKGRLLANLNEFSEAEKYYNKVLEMESKNISALYLKSRLIKSETNVSETPHDLAIKALEYWEVEDFKNATSSIEKAVEIDDGYCEIFFIQGELYIRTGRIEDAINSFKKAFKLNPHAGGIKNKDKLFKLLSKMKKINTLLRFE